MFSANTVKYVIVTEGPLTITQAEELRLDAIRAAKESTDVPVLMLCDYILTTEDMIKIKNMIDTEIAWVRVGNSLANLMIAQI